MALTYQDLWQRLLPLYEPSEARAVIRLVLEEQYGLTLTDIVFGRLADLSERQQRQLSAVVARLAEGQPVQYVLGYTSFCGRRYRVTPDVLIPRPETEGLAPGVLAEVPRHPRVLDIGTGTGCIAVTWALDTADATVTAWDISPEALAVARENARRLGASVHFVQQDMLHAPDDTAVWDVIVSNPPYVAEKEKAVMEHNVLDYEPSLALFVPDDDPLKFYRAIARYGTHALRPHGQLLLEINPLYARMLRQMIAGMGYEDVRLHEDVFGKTRYVSCLKRLTPTPPQKGGDSICFKAE